MAFSRRYAPYLLRMKSLLAEVGAIDPLSRQFHCVQRSEPRFAYGTGPHGLDTLRFLASSEVCAPSARALVCEEAPG